MLHKLRTAAGKLLYAARKHIVEPVFGQIKSAHGIRAFLLRGLEKVSAEWQLICLTHNLLKIWLSVVAFLRIEEDSAPSAGRRPQRPPPGQNECSCGAGD